MYDWVMICVSVYTCECGGHVVDVCVCVDIWELSGSGRMYG